MSNAGCLCKAGVCVISAVARTIHSQICCGGIRVTWETGGRIGLILLADLAGGCFAEGGFQLIIMDTDLAQRLERIETHLAHLEKQYEDLNQVVVEHGKLLRKMQANQQRLAEVVETSELERIRATNPKPPHYQ